jgi:hypothetical protein
LHSHLLPHFLADSAPVAQLDLATVVKMSQALSSELVLDTLLDTLLRLAMVELSEDWRQVNSSSNALASCKSLVPNPSVNQS